MSDPQASVTIDWILDFDSLMQPVAEEHPCGAEQDLGLAENQRGMFDMLGSNWCQPGYGTATGEIEKNVQNFLRESQEIFATKCKSLELPVVCTPLMVQTYGLPGLRDTLEWINRSLLQHGTQLYPKHPNGVADTANRLARVFRSQYFARSGMGSWSNLAHQLRMLPINSRQDDAKVYADLMAVFATAGESKPSFPEDLSKRAINETAGFYQEILDAADYCLKACGEINKNFRTVYNFDGVGSLRLIPHELVTFLEDFRRHIHDFADEFCADFRRAKIARAAAQRGSQSGAETGGHPGAATGGVARMANFDGEVHSRDDAVRLLKKVADYFLKTELHSPVGYRLQEALEWTKLSLPELLVKLMGSDTENYRRVAARIGFESQVEE